MVENMEKDECKSKSFLLNNKNNNHVYILQYVFDPLICDNQFNRITFFQISFYYLSNICQLLQTHHTLVKFNFNWITVQSRI